MITVMILSSANLKKLSCRQPVMKLMGVFPQPRAVLQKMNTRRVRSLPVLPRETGPPPVRTRTFPSNLASVRMFTDLLEGTDPSIHPVIRGAHLLHPKNSFDSIRVASG